MKYFKSRVLIRNFLSFALVEAFLICILFYVYVDQLEKKVADENIIRSRAELERSAETLDSVMEQVRSFAYAISIEDDTERFLVTKVLGVDEKNVEALVNKMKLCTDIFEYIDSAYVYSESTGQVVSDKGLTELEDMPDTNWLEIYEDIDEERYVWGSRCKNDRYPYLLSVIWVLRDGGNKKLGSVVINIDLDALNTFMGRDSRDSSTIYMMGQDGSLYYSNKTKLIKNDDDFLPDAEEIKHCMESSYEYCKVQEIDERQQLIMALNTGKWDWTYIMIFEIENPYAGFGMARDFVRVYIPLAIGLVLVISFVFAIYAYHPIRHIMNTVREDVEFSETFLLPSNPGDEVQYITGLIINAKRKRERLEIEVDEWRERLGYAQLQALQSQINPHVLYNTLDTINWMAAEKLGIKNEVSTAICILADLLRVSLDRTTYLITLKEELEHVRMYVEILGIRYPNKFVVHWNVEEELFGIKVVRLSLQPLLENAVRHGLRSKKAQGNIYIWGNIVNEVLVLRIEDDGVGMTLEECHAMNRILNTEYEKVDTHVGIKNVNQRIKILFGEDYGIQIRPRESGGLCVTVAFPLQFEEK